MRRPLASLLGRPNPTDPGDAADLSNRRVMVGRASVPQVEIDQASVDFRPPLSESDATGWACECNFKTPHFWETQYQPKGLCLIVAR